MLYFSSFGLKSQNISKHIEDLATEVILDNTSERFKAAFCPVWHQGFNPSVLSAGTFLKVKGKPQCFVVTHFVGVVCTYL